MPNRLLIFSVSMILIQRQKENDGFMVFYKKEKETHRKSVFIVFHIFSHVKSTFRLIKSSLVPDSVTLDLLLHKRIRQGRLVVILTSDKKKNLRRTIKKETEH